MIFLRRNVCITCSALPSCPTCASDEICSQTTQTCDECATVQCVSISSIDSNNSTSSQSNSTDSGNLDSSDGHSSLAGDIVGGVVGGLAIIIIILCFIIYMQYRKHRLPHGIASEEDDPNDTGDRIPFNAEKHGYDSYNHDKYDLENMDGDNDNDSNVENDSSVYNSENYERLFVRNPTQNIGDLKFSAADLLRGRSPSRNASYGLDNYTSYAYDNNGLTSPTSLVSAQAGASPSRHSQYSVGEIAVAEEAKGAKAQIVSARRIAGPYGRID